MISKDRIEKDGMHTLTVINHNYDKNFRFFKGLEIKHPDTIKVIRFSRGARELFGDLARVEVSADLYDYLKKNRGNFYRRLNATLAGRTG